MATRKKSKGVLEQIGDAVSSGAEAVIDAGSKAIHAVGDMMPTGKPAPKRAKTKAKAVVPTASKTSPKAEAPKATKAAKPPVAKAKVKVTAAEPAAEKPVKAASPSKKKAATARKA